MDQESINQMQMYQAQMDRQRVLNEKESLFQQSQVDQYLMEVRAKFFQNKIQIPIPLTDDNKQIIKNAEGKIEYVKDETGNTVKAWVDIGSPYDEIWNSDISTSFYSPQEKKLNDMIINNISGLYAFALKHRMNLSRAINNQSHFYSGSGLHSRGTGETARTVKTIFMNQKTDLRQTPLNENKGFLGWLK